MSNHYQQFILKVLVRILSNLDRDPDSPTYGCFDRGFWLYRTKDFPNAILQQNCLTMAVVYLNGFEGNIYYQKSRIKEWALAAVKFWNKIQHIDGSFDEYWKNERGLPPTVFSTFAVSETIRLLGIKDQTFFNSFKKACNFLAKNQETFACNQEVAATASVYSVYLNTQDEDLLQLYKSKLENLKKFQSQEGFFYEQRGADAGYLSVSINYLAWLYQQTGDGQIKEMADKAVEFLSYLIHPDGSLGGEYGSRNTEYLLPAGLKILGSENPLAASILNMAEEYFKGYDNFPIGDYYLLHYLGPSYALATTQNKPSTQKVELPFLKEFVKHFPDAGLLIVSQKNSYLIINIKKGGVFKLYSKGKLLANDLGYRVREKNGRIYFSEYGNENPELKLETEGQIKLEINKLFSLKKYLQMTPIKRFILYLFSTIFGRSFRKLIKKKALISNKGSKYSLIRTIEVTDQLIKISDKISPLVTSGDLIRAVSQSIKIIPSAKFFQVTELDNKLYHKTIPNPPEQIKTVIDLKEDRVEVNY